MDHPGHTADAARMTKAPAWWKMAAAVASGLLVAGLFPPFGASWLVWVSLLPLLVALSSIRGKRAGWKGFGLAYLGGAVSCLIQFNWLATVSWLGAILMPLYLAMYWGLFGWFAATLGNRMRGGRFRDALLVAFCHAAVWAGLEWLRGWMLTGFSWNSLGMALGDTRAMAQGADLLGVTGLSLALVFLQSLLAPWLTASRRTPREPAVVLLLIGALFVYGKIRIGIEEKAESVRLKTLLVQIHIPQDAAQVLWTDLEVHRAYEEETLKALDALKNEEGIPSPDWPDWVMWPECALTGRILATDDGGRWNWQINQDTISQVRAAGPFTLIYGVNEQEAQIEGEMVVAKPKGRAYNSIAVLSPEDEITTYRKHHLVIFGETIPFVDSVPWLKRIYEQQSGAEYLGSFTPGDSFDPLPIPLRDKMIGAVPSICFEDSVARLTRKFVREEPQIIINVTNDGWFKESAAAAQHFMAARFRAIELRRPLLRCANSGVSAAIDSTGSTAHPDTGVPQVLTDPAGNHFTRGSLLVDVKIPLHPSFSLYALVGDAGILGCSAAGILAAILVGRRRAPGSAS